VNYTKLLERDCFFTWHIFLQLGKTQDLPNENCQTLGDEHFGHLILKKTDHLGNCALSQS
jgi:hypothetical protein